MLSHRCPNCRSSFATVEELNAHSVFRHAPEGTRQAIKRFRRHVGLPVSREPIPEFAWPGGYPIVYVFRDGGCICAPCVNREILEIDSANRTGQGRNSHGGWAVDAFDIHYEGEPEICDHCGKSVDSAYGVPEKADS
jgi:hypothetical protein